MTSNFDARKHSRQEAAKQMDSLQRDRFELLSAFIDGEVTAAERRQVQELLATDADMQRLHSRLMKLRQGMQKLPVPAAQTTAQDTAQEVFSRIDHRRNRRTVMWGGAAIAAMVVGALSGILPGSDSLVPRLAQSLNKEVAPEPLEIAINRPVIEIPKAAVALPEQSLDLPTVPHETNQNDLN
ncbi:Fis family transcriptional regulator [Microcoleus sp. FACHB-SPT15]|uniref:anti-sigma factor family protein n=1 Tax=Microcoleus sp. FACHB-SPT15 TaxID=2692830 RepID=UPI00177C7696|nr:Fis family transcriptional regulator [Microcoleus sp. FACHB-SPT15]MBD1804426.1 Fis family transcriptional regulator [Microcoleus sp. FACHB-SPT15]